MLNIYDGTVYCNCYQAGKTKMPPPYPDLITIEQGEVRLDISDSIWESDIEEANRMHCALETWKEEACEHPLMVIDDLEVASAFDMQNFQINLETIGGEAKWPLLTYLDLFSGEGFTPASFAPDLLREIKALKANQTQFVRVSLIETETQEVIASTPIHKEQIFAADEEEAQSYMLNENGFQILSHDHTDLPPVLFQSVRFRQCGNEVGQLIFEDLQDGTKIICPIQLYPTYAQAMPEHSFVFEVQNLVGTMYQTYTEMIDAISTLAEAAKASGNPIHWT
jgi:hypothetical protein